MVELLVIATDSICYLCFALTLGIFMRITALVNCKYNPYHDQHSSLSTRVRSTSCSIPMMAPRRSHSNMGILCFPQARVYKIRQHLVSMCVHGNRNIAQSFFPLHQDSCGDRVCQEDTNIVPSVTGTLSKNPSPAWPLIKSSAS